LLATSYDKPPKPTWGDRFAKDIVAASPGGFPSGEMHFDVDAVPGCPPEFSRRCSVSA
jgi:hypothetical protein